MPEGGIISCECGANVRLPKDSAKRAFRCPICKTALALTVDAKVLSARQLQAGDPGYQKLKISPEKSTADVASGSTRGHRCDTYYNVLKTTLVERLLLAANLQQIGQ